MGRPAGLRVPANIPGLGNSDIGGSKAGHGQIQITKGKVNPSPIGFPKDRLQITGINYGPVPG